MKLLRIAKYVWFYPDYCLGLTNENPCIQYINNIKSNLMIEGIIPINNSSDFSGLEDLNLNMIFGIHSKIISSHYLNILVQHLPKSNLLKMWIFDYYLSPIHKNKISNIPLSYLFFCFWDIISTFSNNKAIPISLARVIETILWCEYFGIEYTINSGAIVQQIQFKPPNLAQRKQISHYIYQLAYGDGVAFSFLEQDLYKREFLPERRAQYVNNQRQKFIQSQIQKILLINQ